MGVSSVSDRLLLTIITPVIRPHGVAAIARSIAAAEPHRLEIRHLVAYYPHMPDPSNGPERAVWATELIGQVRDGWVLFVDDDNRLHPELPRRLEGLIVNEPNAWAFAFDCVYPEQAHGLLRARAPQPSQIDGGQVVLWWYLAQMEPWPTGACADGVWLSALHRKDPGAWVFVNEPLTYHNHQVWAK